MLDVTPYLQRRPRLRALLRGIVLTSALGGVLLLGGCLQDAHNANNDFNFDNPVDPTPTNSSGINIAEVDTSLQIVTLVNSSGTAQDMTSLTLVEGTTTYTFPNAFSLGTGAFVRVHTAAGTDAPPLDLYGSALPLHGGDTLTLNNLSTVISSCSIGTPTCH